MEENEEAEWAELAQQFEVDSLADELARGNEVEVLGGFTQLPSKAQTRSAREKATIMPDQSFEELVLSRIRDLLYSDELIGAYANKYARERLRGILEYIPIEERILKVPGEVYFYVWEYEPEMVKEDWPEPWDSMYWEAYANAMLRIINRATGEK